MSAHLRCSAWLKILHDHHRWSAWQLQQLHQTTRIELNNSISSVVQGDGIASAQNNAWRAMLNTACHGPA